MSDEKVNVAEAAGISQGAAYGAVPAVGNPAYDPQVHGMWHPSNPGIAAFGGVPLDEFDPAYSRIQDQGGLPDADVVPHEEVVDYELAERLKGVNIQVHGIDYQPQPTVADASEGEHYQLAIAAEAAERERAKAIRENAELAHLEAQRIAIEEAAANVPADQGVVEDDSQAESEVSQETKRGPGRPKKS